VTSAVDHFVAVLVFCLFAAAPVPIGLCAVMLGRSETGRPSLPQASLLLLAAWCVVQAVVAHVLGVLHQLQFSGALVAELAVLGGGALSLARLRRRRDDPAWGALTRSSGQADGLETVALLTLAFMGLTLLWWSIAMPVVDYDSWAFHMPHMAQWLQSGSFTRMVQEATRPRNSYPYGWEALCTLFLLPFGEDMLVTFPNLVAWVLLGLATYLLARLWRARRIHALACAAMLLAIHYVADPVNTMHVDLPFAALFMASVYLGMVGTRGCTLVPLVLGAATMGLACGVRVTGPAYALGLGGWLVFVRSGTGAGESHPREGLGLAALATLAAALLLAGFWYGKNLLELGHLLGGGNPHDGPASVEGTWSYFATSTLAYRVNPLQMSSWKVLIDRAFGELDAPFVAIVALAALWPLANLTECRNRRDESASALVLLLLGTGALFWVTPLSANSGIQVRLGLPFLASLAVAATVGASRARLPGEVSVALALMAATRSFSGSRVLYALVLLVVLWGLWRGRRETSSWTPRARLLVGAGSLFLALATITFLGRHRREREREKTYGPFYEYLEHQVSPSEPLAYLASSRSYLFYGRRLARSVIYAPLLEGQGIEAWVEPLRERNIHLVAVGPWSGDGPERANLERLTGPGGPLLAVWGSGEPGEVSLFRLR
jgi:hypothetical protein